jgi:predicted NBD/HSP70 family sugar kinase
VGKAIFWQSLALKATYLNKIFCMVCYRTDILNIIRHAGTISINEIVARTGQSKASVTRSIQRFKQLNLISIKKVVRVGQPGKYRLPLTLNSDAAYTLGLQLTESFIIGVVVDFKGEIEASLQLPCQLGKHPSPKHWGDQIETCLRRCIDKADLSLPQISGIGIGLPDFMEGGSNNRHWSFLFESKGESISSQIQHRLNIPTLMENDGIAAAMTHKWHGIDREVNNFIVITLDDGIGVGIVINHQIYRGTAGGAGQFAHMVAVPGGVACLCGKRGCLEAYAGGQAIIKAAKRACADGQWTWASLDNLSLQDLIATAQNGDVVVEDIFRQAGAVLGLGISGLIQLFGPKKIIITGEVTLAGDLLLAPMQEALEIYVNEELLKRVEVSISKSQPTACAQGAAILALKQVYKRFNPVNPI